MLAVRYLTLLALVVWFGSLFALLVLRAPSAELLVRADWVADGCSALLLLGLLTLKFVGPPPDGFFPRIILVALMLAVTLYGQLWRPSTELAAIQILLGLPLLYWYVKE